ncbi:MAG: helix-turn-helix domain-containing protein [Saprospiraceae bacterium]|nr:helix-turn-helix domain-containing protein [Lewinella sp.]
MKSIAILVPKGEVMPNAILGAYFLLTQANFFAQQQGRSAVFAVDLIGYESNTLLYDGSFTVKTRNFRRVKEPYDLLVVPGFTCEMEKPLQMNELLIEWIKEQQLKYGTELAAMCTGAFLLAATGLMDERRCTTHWAFEDSFRERFPAVDFQPNLIVTDDQGFYSSGGAYSSLNLILYLIEKFCGKDVAVWTSKIFQLDMDRRSQKPFVIFNTQKAHKDEAIIAVQAHIEKHFPEELTVNELAKQFAFSRRNFIRRFKEATGNTPIEYIQRVRIEAAKRLLEEGEQNIEEVIDRTGYRDGKAFRTVFKKITGFRPSEYRYKYGRG